MAFNAIRLLNSCGLVGMSSASYAILHGACWVQVFNQFFYPQQSRYVLITDYLFVCQYVSRIIK